MENDTRYNRLLFEETIVHVTHVMHAVASNGAVDVCNLIKYSNIQYVVQYIIVMIYFRRPILNCFVVE